jgi:hypothetical protein
MIRRVFIFDYEFHENRSNHWYDCKITLKKYIPIQPLAYQRTLVDLASYPELPIPIDPSEPGSGSISAQKKSDGSANCIPHTLTEDDLEGTIEDLVAKYYGTNKRTNAGSITYLISKLAQEKNGIHLMDLFISGKSLDDIPPSKRTICIPRTVRITRDGNETIIQAK